MARSRGIEQKLSIDDVFVAIGIEREHAHTNAELEVDDIQDGANANDEVDRAKGAGDGRKDDALLQIKFSAGRSAFSTSSRVIV